MSSPAPSPSPAPAGHTLSTAEAARVLGLSPSRVRALVRTGLCRPPRRGRAYRFRFQDLVVLRAARELLARRVPLARVRRALAALARQLPAERPLSGLRIRADGGRVVVTERGTSWQPETGQLLLDFELDPLAARAARVARLTGDPAPHTQPPRGHARAERAFQQALALEDADPQRALEGYRRAVALDAAFADAWVNLGRLVHARGEAREAVRLYRRALALAPDDAVAHFNLALALEDAADPEAALASYRRALALDPAFADAHYNLAALCEELGRKADALRHYREYRRLTRG